MEEFNQVKSKSIFNIKDDYFIKKVFNNLPKKNLFKVARYNKNTKYIKNRYQRL